MNVGYGTENPKRNFLITTLCTLLVSGLFFSTTASAQINPVEPGVYNHCIETAADSTLNCTANDVNLGLLVVDDPEAECTETAPGSGIFEAQVKFQAELIAGANERWDIGMFIALDGGDARTGECARNYLPSFQFPLAVPGNPGSAGLGNGVGPHYDGEDTEDPGDLCGDLPQGIPWFYDLLPIDEVTGVPTGSLVPETYTVVCVDQDDDGFVDVGTCTSWDNKKTNTCLDLYDNIPNTKAKCNCERTNTTLKMPGFLTVEKICVPSDDDGNFDLEVDGSPAPGGNDVGCGAITDTIVVSIPGADPVNLVVSETINSSGDYDSVIGGDCDASGNVSVDSGESKHCTITNTRIICSPGQDAICAAGPASDVCGVASCDPLGEPDNCDTVTYSPLTTICRPGSGDSCDPDESCTGDSIYCPTDTITPATTTCRTGSGDSCDPDESCTGVAGESCPTDIITPVTTTCRPGANECDPDDSCTGVAGESCPTHETEFCAAEGCSPGFWKTHTELWDGVGGDEATSIYKTTDEWLGDWGIPECDGVDFGSGKTFGDTIATPSEKKGSSNTLFHLTACLVGSDALPGFDEDLNDPVQLLVDITNACAADAAGDSTDLDQLGADCAEANSHNEIDQFCPLDSSGVFTVSKDFSDGNTNPVEVWVTCTNGTVSDNPQYVTESSPGTFHIEGLDPFDVTTCSASESMHADDAGLYDMNQSDCNDGDMIDTGCVMFNSLISTP